MLTIDKKQLYKHRVQINIKPKLPDNTRGIQLMPLGSNTHLLLISFLNESEFKLTVMPIIYDVIASTDELDIKALAKYIESVLLEIGLILNISVKTSNTNAYLDINKIRESRQRLDTPVIPPRPTPSPPPRPQETPRQPPQPYDEPPRPPQQQGEPPRPPEIQDDLSQLRGSSEPLFLTQDMVDNLSNFNFQNPPPQNDEPPENL